VLAVQQQHLPEKKLLEQCDQAGQCLAHLLGARLLQRALLRLLLLLLRGEAAAMPLPM